MNAASDVNLSGSRLLAGFEGGSTDGWGDWTSQSGAMSGPWSVTPANSPDDLAAQGQYALKANITGLGTGQQAILNDQADLDLTDQSQFSAAATLGINLG